MNFMKICLPHQEHRDMKKHLLPLIFFIVLIASCKKDNVSNLLYKEVAKRGTDSIVSTFWYDAQNRLSKKILEDSFEDQTYTLTIIRDNSGRVIKFMDDFVGTNPGSHTTDFFYLSDTDTRIKYAKLYNDPFDDSTVFEYSGNRVTGTKTYRSYGGPFTPIGYREFLYDSRNNITIVKYYEFDAAGTNIQLIGEISSTYDDKINPFYSKDDAFIDFLEFPWPCPNNMTSRTRSYKETITYEYRADGRPTKRTSLVNGRTTVYTYYYR
jgi:hypothetical protein